MRKFFTDRDFIEVQTPILSDSAGGATARPFVTRATALGGNSEDTSRELEMRVAPELWLKRMLVGGFDRVYEIGPVFRNEGIDSTHNPEFTTCEFYMAFASLGTLVDITEELVCEIVQQSSEKSELVRNSIQESGISFSRPFMRLDFIGDLEKYIGCSFPEYVLQIEQTEQTTRQATDFFKDIYSNHGISLPTPLTIPRLFDKLADHFLSPILETCSSPVFLLNFPSSLSPLAKTDPQTGTARRFELYLNGKEIVNAYEEENSPFSQRDKFDIQQRDRLELGDSETPLSDEAYLKSMEWGLPPTGGWGMGIDRLVMFLTGRKRIVDVLSFGGVKNVFNQE